MAEPSNQLGCSDPHRTAAHKERAARRPVNLKGICVLQDQATFDVDVLDLSYDGCRIRAELWPLPGTRFRLSILGIKGALDAMVRWQRKGEAGLQFNSEDCFERTFKDRKEDRIILNAQVSLRLPGRQGYYGRALDLTPEGCKVEFVERPREGDTLWVKFDGLDGIEAKVCWTNGFFGGLEFARPIYPSVFEMLLARLKS